MAKIQEIKAVGSLKIMVFGSAGSGKTNLARSFGRVLLISLERGHITLSNPMALNEIEVEEPKNLKDLRNILKDKNGNIKQEILKNYDTIMIDSATEVSNLILKSLEAQEYYQDPKNALKLWGEQAKILISFLKDLRDISGLNVVIIALDSSEKKGLSETVTPLFDGKKSVKVAPSVYDMYFHLDKRGDCRYIDTSVDGIDFKDRLNVINGDEPLEPFDPFGKILSRLGKHYLKEQLGNDYDKEREKFYEQLASGIGVTVSEVKSRYKID